MKIVGNRIDLDGDEVAVAIDAYLVAHRVHLEGPRTIRLFTPDDKFLFSEVDVEINVDISGHIADNRVKGNESSTTPD
jgi:hypothetical protein